MFFFFKKPRKYLLTGAGAGAGAGAGVDGQLKQPSTKFKPMKQAKIAIAVTDFMFKFNCQMKLWWSTCL